MFRRSCLTLLVISTVACGSQGSPTPPSPVTSMATPIQVSTSSFHLTGIVTDDDGGPVTGATVTVQPWVYGVNVSPVSGMTDGTGFYRIDFDAGRDAAGGVGFVKGESSGHDPSYYYLRPTGQNASQNLHLYRIIRITAGESTVVTVLPGDTLCGDNDQFVCRTLHVAVPSSGTLTIAAVPNSLATNDGLEISGFGQIYQCCSLAVTIPLTGRTEVVLNVGEWWTSTVSESFVVNTSLRTP